MIEDAQQAGVFATHGGLAVGEDARRPRVDRRDRDRRWRASAARATTTSHIRPPERQPDEGQHHAARKRAAPSGSQGVKSGANACVSSSNCRFWAS